MNWLNGVTSIHTITAHISWEN